MDWLLGLAWDVPLYLLKWIKYQRNVYIQRLLRFRMTESCR